MSGQKRTQAIRIITLVLVIILGLVNRSNALEVRLGIQSMATASDNIERAPRGLETEGYLLALEGEVDVSGDLGSGTVDLVMGGGLEFLNSDELSRTDNYRVRLDARVPWTTTGYIEGSAGSSEKTEDPEITDINQARIRTSRFNVGLEAGRRSTPRFQWSAGVNAETERQVARQLEESRGNLSWDFVLDRQRTLVVKMGVNQGTEDIAGNSWTGSSLTLDLIKQKDRLTSSGFRIDLEETQMEKDDGTRELSNRVSAVTHYKVEMRSGGSLAGEFGVDGIKPVIDDRSWEPRAKVMYSGAPERRVQFDSSLSISSSVQGPLENEVAWTRDSQVQTGLRWSVSRTYVVQPRIRYRYADLYGNATADRTDRTVIYELGTRWSPSRTWSLDITAVSETIDSSEPGSDIAENRLRLTLSGTFF